VLSVSLDLKADIFAKIHHMKQTIFTTCCLFVFAVFCHAQLPGVKRIKSTVEKQIESTVSQSLKVNGNSNSEISSGLKEALQQGVRFSVEKLGAVDGFFKDSILKILLPPDARKAESRLRQFGLGKEVDRALLAMNRGAEKAVSISTEIFIQAIRQMSIQDAVGILRGNQDAATQYLYRTCRESLSRNMKPIVQQALDQVEATRYWDDVVRPYNRISQQKINPDLTEYVTQKALDGLFNRIAAEEKRIRQDPMARTTELLQKVFSNNP
jgi:hypothetical protein